MELIDTALKLYQDERIRHDATRDRLLKEISELRARLNKTDEALYFAVEALDHLGYEDVEVKRGKAINEENKAAEKAYWNSLCADIAKPLK